MKALAALALPLLGCATISAPVPQSPARAAIAFDALGERGVSVEGMADHAAGRMVTPDDPVRIASISKLVVAIGVMRLVEQGKLDLDADVSTYLGWRLRNPAFPDRPLKLRQLLSHTSSVRDHDDQYAIPLGGSLRAVIAESESWDPAHAPGTGHFAYANLNFPIVASVMEMATGERFDHLMKRLVIGPMNLDACFNWPGCSDAAIARAVVLTQDGKPIRDDLGGKPPPCPVYVRDGEACDLNRWKLGDNGALFSPQGGLRISARDLARVGRMLLNDGSIDGVQILSRHVGRRNAGAGLAVRRLQRIPRWRERDNLRLRPCRPPAGKRRARLRGRPGRRRPLLAWPFGRRLWPALRLMDRPRARRRHRLFRQRSPGKPAPRPKRFPQGGRESFSASGETDWPLKHNPTRFLPRSVLRSNVHRRPRARQFYRE